MKSVNKAETAASTAPESLQLAQQGLSPEEIAQARLVRAWMQQQKKDNG